MSTPTIDYTTWRKGKRVHRTSKIAVCPKCGKKGEYRPSWSDKKGKTHSAEYIHSGHIVAIAGMEFFHVDSICYVKETEAQS